MCGIALKHDGHTVTILERGDSARQSHQAGIALGTDVERFLQRHDRLTSVFSSRALCLQTLDKEESPKMFLTARRDITSWDSMYFRLRANFDGLKSSFYPSPPQKAATDGLAEYAAHREVCDLSRNSQTGKMIVTMRDRNANNAESSIEADLVIGADGPDSWVRARYLPSCKRQFSGYVGWRGTVLERELSASTVRVFRNSLTIHLMGGQHVMCYLIPGRDGTVEKGERYANLIWYTNETQASLDEIMTDAIDGHRHRNIIPAGHVRKDIWDQKVADAHDLKFPSPFLEVVQKIQQPFIQIITDYISPHPTFENGQVVLIGDAFTQYRTHTGMSTTQAAFNTLTVADYAAGRMSKAVLEERMLRYAGVHHAQSNMFGKYYQVGKWEAIKAACWFGWLAAADKVKSWWNREEPLMRGFSRVAPEEWQAALNEAD